MTVSKGIDERTPDPMHESADEKGANERKQHDLVFKTLLRHFFADLIELTEPEFAERVDLTRVEFLDKETFSDFPTGLRREADLVARLTSRDGEGRIVLVQTEVEGEFGSEMDERGFHYYLYLRGKYQVPVLLIVVFLRGGRGKSLTVRQYVDRAESVEVCRFRYLAFFLAQSRAEKFVELRQALAPALAALMKSDWDPVGKKLRCLKAISRAEVDDARRFLLAKIVDLYVELDEVQAERFAAETAKPDNEEVRKMVITWEETLADREAQGEAKATRNNILRVLQRRLRSVPAFVRQELDAIQNVERLEEILDQALTVNSVNELALDREPDRA